MKHFSAQLEWFDDIKNRNLFFLSSKNVVGRTCWCNMYNAVGKTRNSYY